MTKRGCLIGWVVVVASLAPRAVQAGAVLDWNSIALDVLRAEATHPPKVGRDLAIVHAAVFDAVNSVEGGYTPIVGLLSIPTGGVSLDAAVAAAAHDCLVSLYPAQQADLDQHLADVLAGIPAGTARDNGLVVGAAAAAASLAWRANDGWDAPSSYVPNPIPGHWRPTPPAYAPALAPQWGDVLPFGVADIQAHVPGPPPALDSAEYAAAWQQVRDLGGTVSMIRTADQEQIAEFWNDTPGRTAAPPGKWNLIAQTLAEQAGTDLAENARLFALLNISLADVGVVAWRTKFTYDLWRPEDAIRLADTDGNPDTDAQVDWEPLWPSPPFPEYVSGHSTFSGAGSTLLALFFGTDDIAFTIPAGWDVLPGVTRSYASLSEAAEEAGMSRIYGGIHFSFSDVAGRAAGGAIASEVFENVAVPEPAAAALLCMGAATLLPRRRRRAR